MVVIVGAFQRFPIIETLPPFTRNKVGAAIAIQVPFANITRIIACPAKHFGQRDRIGRQWHVVHKHTRGERPLARQ